MTRRYASWTRFQTAWDARYAALAKVIAEFLPSKGATVVEVGCGRGQLTIPLANAAVRYQVVGVDSYAGPYAGDLRSLKEALRRHDLNGRVAVTTSDGLQWLARRREGLYDGLISSEFLPELDSTELGEFLVGSYRVLKKGGVAIHAFLSPVARTAAQRLLIEADSDPRWTRHPPKEWFSPPPKLVAERLRAAGFRHVAGVSLRNSVAARGEAATVLLDRYGVRRAFWEARRRRLARGGLEMPDWAVLVGWKPRR